MGSLLGNLCRSTADICISSTLPELDVMNSPSCSSRIQMTQYPDRRGALGSSAHILTLISFAIPTRSPKTTAARTIGIRGWHRYTRTPHTQNLTHFSSESYGEHLAHALGCKHIMVDCERAHVPISGTIVRTDPAKYQHFLPEFVRAYYLK